MHYDRSVTLLIRALVLVSGVILPSWVHAAESWAMTPEEERLMPPICKSGKGYPGLLHFCHGIKFTMRADRTFDNPRKQSFNLKSAVGEFSYVAEGSHKFTTVSEKELNSYLAVTYLKLGDLQRRLKNTEKSLQMYHQAIKRNPRMTQAYSGLSDIYKNLGMLKEAKETLEKGLQQKPNSKALKRRLTRLEQ